MVGLYSFLLIVLVGSHIGPSCSAVVTKRLIGVSNSTCAPRWCRATAISSTGERIVAVDNVEGKIFKSSDFGLSWTECVNAPSYKWTSVASSADGNKLVAVGNYKVGAANPDSHCVIYTSSDYGESWILRRNSSNSSSATCHYNNIVSSGDGTKLLLFTHRDHSYSGRGYLQSTDSGITWAHVYSTYWDSSRSLGNVWSSSDGNILAGTGSGGGGADVAISSNAGTNWTLLRSDVANSAMYTTVALSDNGATIITGQYYPFTSPLLSISYNYGANWSTVIQLKRRVASPTTATHPLVSCSSDCTKIVAVLQVVDSYNRPINSSVWGSTNGGLNWTEFTELTALALPFHMPQLSSDGEKLVLTTHDGSVWTSGNNKIWQDIGATTTTNNNLLSTASRLENYSLLPAFLSAAFCLLMPSYY